MNPMLVKTFKLTLICGIAALLLGIVNSITEPQIAIRKEERIQKVLSSLLSKGNVGSPEEESSEFIDLSYPVVVDGEVQAYILSLISKGYGGEIKLLAAFDLKGEVINAQLMDNNETPGLGKKAESPVYMKKFIGTGSTRPVPIRKDQVDQDVDDITGATITFSGVAKALAMGSDFVKNKD